jgi:tetratricopeptide (TPR) repeat protein
MIRQEIERLVAARDFATLQTRAQAAHAAIAADPQLQQLMAHAQELMEASPYVDRFLQQARAAQAAGRLDDVRTALDKARTLDPAHPAIAEVEAAAAESAHGATEPALSFDSLPELAFDEQHGDNAFAPALGEEHAFGSTLEPPPLDLPDLDASALPEPSFDAEPAFAAAPAFGDETVDVHGGARRGGPSDPDPRVAELLDEGQALLDRGELQGAIDAWSRIFLIDIDHQEAARRIEHARTAKAEQERQVEESYHEALAQAQGGDAASAKATLEHVLALQPNHVAARDALSRLERGEPIEAPRAAGGGAAAVAGGEIGGLGLGEGGGDAELKEEILVPPEPGSAPARAAAPVKGGGRRPLMLAAVGVLALVVAGGFLVWKNWSTWFPNTAEAGNPKKAEQTPITRANELYHQGKRAIAIAQLKRVPPASPFYEEAQALLGKWEPEEAASNTSGPNAEQQARRDALMAQAKQAASERRFLTVGPLLDQVAKIAPLSEEEKALRSQADDALKPLQPSLSMLKAEEYDQAARQLWVILEKDSGNADARVLLTTAYYNLGVLGLQQGKPDEAETSLKEAATLTPTDPDVQRLLQLAATYKERTPDLLYTIYTKYLNQRPV